MYCALKPAPNHRQLDRLSELGQPASGRVLVARIAKAPSFEDVEEHLELLLAGKQFSDRQLRRVDGVLRRTMLRS